MHPHNDDKGLVARSPSQSSGLYLFPPTSATLQAPYKSYRNSADYFFPANHSLLPYSHPPSRQSSLSRRQASLSSPREIPLPSCTSSALSNSQPHSPEPSSFDHPGTELSTHSTLRMSHNFLRSRSVASEPSAKSNHALPSPSSDSPEAFPSILHQEKSNEAIAPESAPSVQFSCSISDSRPKSHAGPVSQPDSLSRGENRLDHIPLASRPLSEPFNDILPVAGLPSGHISLRDNALQSSSGEVTKRRPLPLPPSSSQFSRLSDLIPSSPPPPYSRFLPDEDPALTARDLSRVPSSSATHNTLVPEAPIIMTPPENEQGSQGRPPYDSFLCHSPPANTWIVVETSPSEYVLVVQLPGFKRDGITIATKRRRILHIVADSWEPEGGHFERRVSFGHDAELAQVRAEFDGDMLRIVVPRHISAITS